jgi:hypothetical protein
MLIFMTEPRVDHNLIQDEVNHAFRKFETMLSSQKARDCLSKAEAALAFDVEIFLQPIRLELAACMELIADLIRERGTASGHIQSLIPTLSTYLDPGQATSKEIARLEKEIADKKRNHPDFVYAAKLNVLIQNYDSMLKNDNLDSIEYGKVLDKYEAAKRTLSDHVQKKIRIAQKAFAPDLLELAQSQLTLAIHQEKILSIKNDLLNAVQEQTKGTLQNLAKIFEEADPELANTILVETQSLIQAGRMTTSPGQKKIPTNLSEFKEELSNQQKKLDTLEHQQKACLEQLQKLVEFENAIFNTYGDKLRSKGVQFKKTLTVDKSGVGVKGPSKKKASRMVRHE